MKKDVFVLVAILFLLSVSSITGLIHVVKADGATITINADGSITPPTAPIYAADNITYTLTGNITATANADGIVIERNNIVLNGAGYTVTGSGSGGNGTALYGRTNVTVRNVTIRNFTTGIWLDYSSNNTLSGNNLTGNSMFGIWLGSSSDNTLTSNTIADNGYGIKLDYVSSGNVISSNNLTEDGLYAIWIDGESSSNLLWGNNITESQLCGIFLDQSSYNIVSGNNITNNGALFHSYGFASGGIEINSGGNSIYHNNFINNTYQVLSYDSTNVWDDGYPSGGNYWSDYNGTDLHGGLYQNLTGSDGIGDTPYVIVANNNDDYPLMGTFQSFNVSNYNGPSVKFDEVDIISNATIGRLDTLFADDVNSPTGMDWFLTLAGIVGQNGTTGFCRITFPNDLMNYLTYHVATWEQIEYGANVTMDGANCTILNSNSENTTLYFTFNLSDLSRTLPYPDFNLIILPEFPSFLILSLFMIATLLAVIVCKKKGVKTSQS